MFTSLPSDLLAFLVLLATTIIDWVHWRSPEGTFGPLILTSLPPDLLASLVLLAITIIDWVARMSRESTLGLLMFTSLPGDMLVFLFSQLRLSSIGSRGGPLRVP